MSSYLLPFLFWSRFWESQTLICWEIMERFVGWAITFWSLLSISFLEAQLPFVFLTESLTGREFYFFFTKIILIFFEIFRAQLEIWRRISYFVTGFKETVVRKLGFWSKNLGLTLTVTQKLPAVSSPVRLKSQ